MEGIKAVYQQQYERALEDDVHEDTSGAYRALMIALVKG
jgi:hypothetical protein